MEYCELGRIGEVNACAKEGWRLAFVTRNTHGSPVFIMERSVKYSYPIYMTPEGPLALNTPEAWKRYHEEIRRSPQ